MARLITDGDSAQIATPDLAEEVEIRTTAGRTVRLPAAAQGKVARLHFAQCSAMAPIAVAGLTSSVPTWSAPVVGDNPPVTAAGTNRTYQRTPAGWTRTS